MDFRPHEASGGLGSDKNEGVAGMHCSCVGITHGDGRALATPTPTFRAYYKCNHMTVLIVGSWVNILIT